MLNIWGMPVHYNLYAAPQPSECVLHVSRKRKASSSETEEVASKKGLSTTETEGSGIGISMVSTVFTEGCFCHKREWCVRNGLPAWLLVCQINLAAFSFDIPYIPLILSCMMNGVLTFRHRTIRGVEVHRYVHSVYMWIESIFFQ